MNLFPSFTALQPLESMGYALICSSRMLWPVRIAYARGLF